MAKIGPMFNLPPADRRKLSRSLEIWILMLTLCITLAIPGKIYAQEDVDYDEIGVFLTVQKVGSIDISAVIRDEDAYLPITEIFDFLKIKNMISPELDSVSGFFINPKTLFLVDFPNNRIMFDDKTIQLQEGAMIKTETNLYLLTTYFGQVFALNSSFNFRGLAVIMDTKLELPIIREMKLAQMRNNINKLKGEVKADTILPRTYPLFHMGMADWSIISNQLVKGRNDTRMNLALGAVVAGGEANVSLLVNNNQPFDEKLQQYLWRFANNDFRYVRQVLAGKIASQATASIYAPVVGVQFTNSPTTFRRSFGYYNLSDKTEPGWTVELYVNNVLVDYMRADASGFFTFQVPLVYGNSAVMLKFYGPWGEERTKEQNISIPFNFLPQGELQYTASAGFVEDSLGSKFSRTIVNYGLTSRLTMGAGTEYLSSVKSGALMPFVNASLRLASSLLLSGEYTYGVRKKGILSYRFPSNLQFEIYYTKYEPNQKAINYNYLEERKAVVAIPIRTKSFSAFSRLTLNQIILPESRYTTAEMLLSGAIYGVSTNLTSYAMFVDPANPYVYSNLSFSFRLPKAFVLIPQAQYEYNNNKLISLKCGLEKHVWKNGFVNISYEKNFKSDITNIEFGFRYDLSFAQAAFTSRLINNNLMLTQSARGSLMYDRKTSYLHAGNRTSVGKGGIVIVTYLDLNCNGKREADEPKTIGLNVHLTGGRIEVSKKDSTIRIFDLEPYIAYYLEFDRNSFDNISWQLRTKSMKINIDPNQFRLVEVPISVFGEVSGTIYLQGTKSQKGLGRIIVCFYNEAGKLSGRTLSESDGYFNYLGLPPGKYIARVDTNQLRKINMSSQPSFFEFEMMKSEDGDVKDDFEFILKPEKPETQLIQGNLSPGKVEQDEQKTIVTIAKEPVTIIPQINAKPEEKGQTQVAVSSAVKEIPARKETAAMEKNKVADKGSKQPDKTPENKQKINVPEMDSQILDQNGKEESMSRLKALKMEQPLSGTFAIQVGAFSSLENALRNRERLIDALAMDVFIAEENKFYKVMVTGFNDLKTAQTALSKVKSRGFAEAYIVKIK
jgi:cell division protein FtsN